MTRLAPILGLGLAAFGALPVSAQAVMWNCHFTERCSDDSCSPNDANYSFRLDAANGTGEMIASGTSYAGTVTVMGGLWHFLFVNDAGSELTTISESGVVSYSGHMDGSPQLATYRLSGTCTRGKG